MSQVEFDAFLAYLRTLPQAPELTPWQRDLARQVMALGPGERLQWMPGPRMGNRWLTEKMRLFYALRGWTVRPVGSGFIATPPEVRPHGD